MILRCVCQSEFQDREHGLSMRVHNPCGQRTNPQARCTVCQKEQPVPANMREGL